MATPLKLTTVAFLEEVPVFASFEDVPDFTRYVDVPKDWYLFVSDIRGSTKATEEGRYKDVNVVGASAVMAVLNAIKPQEIFYIFGGDGATFLSPPELLPEIQQALLGAKQLAKEGFGFELRIGMVPVWHLYAANFDLKVAKYRVSKHIVQSALGGDGLSQAETWVKNPPFNESYEVADQVLQAPADTTGLECRWNPVKSQRGQMTSILVQSVSLDQAVARKDYQQVMDLVTEMLSGKNPVISEPQLSLSWKPQSYSAEFKSRTHRKGLWEKAKHLVWSYGGTLLFSFLWKTLFKKDGDQYRKELVENSDYRKFDGTLRMVLDLSNGQLKRLETMLAEKAERDEVIYGIHTSDSALMTCLIFNRAQGNHLHFVDGNDGGYSSAAKDFKKRLSARNEMICSVKKPRKAG